MKEHLNITVNGKVKEIDFLYYSHLSAHKNNITGFVQNGSDTSIYIEAEGTSEELKIFIEYFNNGPLSNHFDDMQVDKGDLKNFMYFKRTKDREQEKKKHDFFRKFFSKKK